MATGGKRWITELESRERESTGISNLKVVSNGAFGYFIEVTKRIFMVPENYVRKQTMTNAERFYTDELRQKEKEILNAEETAVAREQIFIELVEKLSQRMNCLRSLRCLLKSTSFPLGENLSRA